MSASSLSSLSTNAKTRRGISLPKGVRLGVFVGSAITLLPLRFQAWMTRLLLHTKRRFSLANLEKNESKGNRIYESFTF